MGWLRSHEDLLNGGPEDPIILGYKDKKISDTVSGIQVYAVGDIPHPYDAGDYFAIKEKIFYLRLLQDTSGWDNYDEIVDRIITSLKISQ